MAVRTDPNLPVISVSLAVRDPVQDTRPPPGYPGAALPKIYTKRGDDGTTGLLYGGRISKADAAAEAYGTVDEAVADLGVARAHAEGPEADALLRLQRELFVIGADLATNPDDRGKLEPGVSLTTAEMVSRLESLIDEAVERHPL